MVSHDSVTARPGARVGELKAWMSTVVPCPPCLLPPDQAPAKRTRRCRAGRRDRRPSRQQDRRRASATAAASSVWPLPRRAVQGSDGCATCRAAAVGGCIQAGGCIRPARRGNGRRTARNGGTHPGSCRHAALDAAATRPSGTERAMGAADGAQPAASSRSAGAPHPAHPAPQ